MRLDDAWMKIVSLYQDEPKEMPNLAKRHLFPWVRLVKDGIPFCKKAICDTWRELDELDGKVGKATKPMVDGGDGLEPSDSTNRRIGINTGWRMEVIWERVVTAGLSSHISFCEVSTCTFQGPRDL